MPPLSDGDRSARSSISSPGAMNVRSFISGTLVAMSCAPAGHCGGASRTLQRHLDLRVQQHRSREHLAAREVIGEELRLVRHLQQGTHALDLEPAR